jgi:hypothetical protein
MKLAKMIQKCMECKENARRAVPVSTGIGKALTMKAEEI